LQACNATCTASCQKTHLQNSPATRGAFENSTGASTGSEIRKILDLLIEMK
jgi:hypothetical protein